MSRTMYTLEVSSAEFGLISPSSPVIVRRVTGDRLELGEASPVADFGQAIPPGVLLMRDRDGRWFELRYLTARPDNGGEAEHCWMRIR